LDVLQENRMQTTNASVQNQERKEEMNNQTQTPRTDEWRKQLEHCIDVSSMTYTQAFLEMADLARQLERELTFKHDAFEKVQATYEVTHASNVKLREERDQLKADNKGMELECVRKQIEITELKAEVERLKKEQD